jgi:gas vesicle protein
MREMRGFAAGVAVAGLVAIFLRSEEGQRLLRRLQEQAEPDIEAAKTEWDPFLREAAKALRLGADEVSKAVDRAAAYIATMAEEAQAESDETEAEADEVPPELSAGSDEPEPSEA